MPKSISFNSWSLGLDYRQGLSTSDANLMRVCKNAHVTNGKTVRKRPGLTLVATLEAGTTGLFSGNGKLNTYYGGTGTITHANTLFATSNLRHPTDNALAISSIHYSDVFNGYQYVSAEYTNGSTRHHYIDGSATFTVTIAAPAVFTQIGHGYVLGRELVFSTTGALPTGLTAGTTYFVIAAGLTADAYQVSATSGGAAVITSGAQSGIHTAKQRTYIVDPNCPHTKQVMKIASKMWAVGTSGDTVRYSKTNGPRDWSTTNDAGFLPVGLQQSGANSATALGYYTNRLVVFFADSAQIWAVDPNPALIALLSEQSVDVGTVHSYAHANMSGDVFFLSPSGVRTITRQDVTTNLIDVDVGSPIDIELLKGTLISLTNPRGQYHRGAGQYWLYSGTKAVVFTFSRSVGISAWSLYEYPFPIDYMDELNAELYMRSGNNVYLVDRNAKTDAGTLFSVDVELAYLDFKAPGVLKQIHAMDAVVTGTCTIAHRYDVRSPDLITNPAVTISGDSRPGNMFPVEMLAVNMAPVLRNFDAGEFELHQISYLFTNLGMM